MKSYQKVLQQVETGGLTSVRDALEQRADEFPDRPLLEFDGSVARTYGGLDERANRVANALRNLGVERDTHVGVLMPNCPAFLDAWFGITKAGGVFVPLNHHHRGRGLAHNVRDTDVEVLVVHQDCLDNYESARPDVDVRHEVVVGGEPAGALADAPRLTGLASAASAQRPPGDRTKTDTHSIVFTSGTTGRPKGVMLPEFGYLNSPLVVARALQWSAEDKHYSTMPLFHGDGQKSTIMATILLGKTVAMEPWFSASKFWDRIEQYGATTFQYVGSIITVLTGSDLPASTPLQRGIGSEATEEAWHTLHDELGIKLVEGYGLTETGNYSTINPPDDITPGSVGKPVRYATVRIVDEADDPVETGEVGEIVIRPAIPNTMMQGYYDRHDATSETWHNLWIHTGDYGYRDDEGYIYFVDRESHLIRRRGENVPATEVESFLSEHDQVEDAAVVGVPSDLGEGDNHIKAYVVANDGADLTGRDVVEHCNGEMAYFKIPRFVEFVDEFPRTPTQRVEKAELDQDGVGDAWDRAEHDIQLVR